MKLGSLSLLFGLAVLVSTAAATPAQAQFYNLEGRFECLGRPGAVCFDATPEVPVAPLATAKSAPVAAMVPVETPRPMPAPVQSKRIVRTVQPVDAKPVETKEAIAARIQAHKLADGDVATLQELSHSGDGRAMELLAWCFLQGVGVARDPIQAYVLYGQAARAAVPNAKANQNWVYTTQLSSDQRQQILMVENSRLSRG